MPAAAPAIRLAGPPDIDALHALIERAYRGDAARAGWTHEADLLTGQRIDPAMLAELLAATDQAMLVALDGDGRTIGCVQITDRGGGLAYLGLLSVAPELQGAGLGKQLILAAEALARARFGATRMEMTTIRQRPELIDYYVRRGYAPTGEERPFPYGDSRFGIPQTDDLRFVVLARALS